MIFGNFVLTLGIIVLESELGEGLLPSHSVGDFVALSQPQILGSRRTISPRKRGLLHCIKMGIIYLTSVGHESAPLLGKCGGNAGVSD
jgi:hypothetical protein